MLLLLAVSAAARPITLEWLSSKPRSYAKDFYIWRYFDQNITPAEADSAFYQLRSVNWKLIRRYAKKTKKPGFAFADRCHRLTPDELPAKEAACTEIAVTPYKYGKLPRYKQFYLLKQLQGYPDTMAWMEVMAAKEPFALVLKQTPDTFFTLFNGCGRTWRKAHLNHPIPTSYLDTLRHDRRFAQSVKLIVTDPGLDQLQYTLLGISPDGLGHQTLFFLAMNALRHGHPALAKFYLEAALQKAWFRFDKDKTLFWLYQIDKNPKTLEALSKSFDLNIYTLFARELLGRPWPPVISPSFEKGHCGYDISDPFAWLKVLDDIGDKNTTYLTRYARKFRCADTLGHYSFLMERAAKWRTHYFPIPYSGALEGLTTDQKAFLLALARQESRFIPSSISPSYALGMMQIMPFLVKALAKERGEPFDLDAMFDPETNIAYARTHMKFLQRRLHHPLFLSYAYNGGIGFTKRMLASRGLFKKGKYEPWLSMELVYYDESRRYGKKVLANYIVYKKLLGEPVTVSSVVEKAVAPSRKGRHRSR